MSFYQKYWSATHRPHEVQRIRFMKFFKKIYLEVSQKLKKYIIHSITQKQK